MQNRINLQLSQQIAEYTCEQVNFDVYWFNPLFGGRLRHYCISKQEIISNLSDEELNQLSKNIVGAIETEERFNIKTYQGMKMSGLAKAYFEGLRFFLASAQLDSKYEVFKPEHDDIQATMVQQIAYDTLYNEPAFRKKTLILGLFKGIQKFANEKQNRLLIQEAIDKKNPDIRKLAITDGALLFFAPYYSYTKSLQAYEKSLLDSFANSKVPNLIPMGTETFNQSWNTNSLLPNDIQQVIAAMLKKEDLANLACLNKEAVKNFKEFGENIKKEQEEKHQLIKKNGY